MGRLSEASNVLNELESRLEGSFDRRLRCRFSLARANHFRITGRINDAMNLLSSALQVAQEECLSREQAIALEYAGDCHLARREFRKAREK